MKSKGVLAFLVAVSAIGIAASQALSAPAATTWTVDKTTGTNNCAGNICKTIAKAVQKSSSGDTIVVHDGLYNENVVIDHPLTLKGGTRAALVNLCSATKPALSTKDTIISATGGFPYAFDIEADNVSISGFVIQNTNPGGWGTVVDLATQNAAYSGFTFTKNVFEQMGAGTTALFLSSNGSNPTLVQANCFRNNAQDAIFAGWGQPDTLKNVTVQGNKFLKNAYGDVIFANPGQSGISITGNISNDDGIFALLTNASNFSVAGNISNHAATGGTAEHAALYLGGNNTNGTIANNIFKYGSEDGMVFDRTYTGVANTNLTISGNIVDGFGGTAFAAPVSRSLKSSTVNGNILKSTGTYGLQLVGGNNTNSFQGNIVYGGTWGCHAMGNSVAGNNWNPNSNIGKPKNTAGTCWP
jgi:hypothetical protein